LRELKTLPEEGLHILMRYREDIHTTYTNDMNRINIVSILGLVCNPHGVFLKAQWHTDALIG
jgi:hypothetical protein